MKESNDVFVGDNISSPGVSDEAVCSVCSSVMQFSLTFTHSGRLNDSLFSFKATACGSMREWREYLTYRAILTDRASDTAGLSNSLT